MVDPSVLADLSQFLLPGRPASYITNLQPGFSNNLEAFIRASPGIMIKSGARSNERQAQLFSDAVAKYGSPQAARKWVAPPGHSMHNVGDAADLSFTGPDSLAWAHQNAGRFGLTFPMSYENWHIEPVGARGNRPAPVAGSSPAAMPASARAMMTSQTPMASQPGMTGAFAPAFGDVVAPQQVQSVPMQPPSLPSLALNFLQQAEERRQREQEQEQQRRQALFAPTVAIAPGSSLAGLYG